MRKPAIIFLMAILLSLSLAGAVSAQEVFVEVLDENDELVDEAPVGSEVEVVVTAVNDGNTTLEDPAVAVIVLPEMALLFNPDEAVADFNGDIFINDPMDPFFYWEDGLWTFWIGWYDYFMYPGDYAMLWVPATVTQAGEITVYAEFYEWPLELDPILLAEDSYTFYGIEYTPEPPEPYAATVPMQETGTPLAVAALGILSLIGGVAYSKLR